MSAEKYAPLDWDAESTLSKEEQEVVETQRRALWERGVRREPGLSEMAFLFAATICGSKKPPEIDLRPKKKSREKR